MVGPRWQNFRYLRYSTLIAVLPTPALPHEHNRDNGIHFPQTGHLLCAALVCPLEPRAGHACLPLLCTLPMVRTMSVVGAVHHCAKAPAVQRGGGCQVMSLWPCWRAGTAQGTSGLRGLR